MSADLSNLPRAPNAAWRRCLWLAAGAYLVASVCGISLTWDGAYYLFSSLEWTEPMVPHGRTVNMVLLGPVVWLSQFIDSPWLLAVAHSLLCSAVSLVCLGGVFALRGPQEWLRWWILFGVLLVPLPGQMCNTAEATPVVQVYFLLLAVLWGMRGWARWVLAGAIGAAMTTFHPAAGPLLLAAAACAVVDPSGVRRSVIDRAVAALIVAAAGAWRIATTVTSATDYEKSQMSANVLWAEGTHLLVCSPWLGVLGLLAAAAAVASGWRDAGGPRRAVLVRWVTVSALAWVALSGLIPHLWSAGLNYRKFGLPTALLATAVCYLAGRRKMSPSDSVLRALMPALALTAVFAGFLIAASLGWAVILRAARSGADADGGAVVDLNRWSWVKCTALEHWGGTPAVWILQGRTPERTILCGSAHWQDARLILYGGHRGIDPSHSRWFDLRRCTGQSLPASASAR